MVRSTRKFVVLGALVVALLLVAAAQSQAYCGWGCYSPASYYTPYYASWGGPCYTSYGCCYGAAYTWPVRRCLLGPYRWYYAGSCCDYGYYYGGGNNCGYGCSYGCGTTVDSCCGTTVTEGAVDVAPAQSAPTMAPPEGDQPATGTAPMGVEGAVVPGDSSAGLPTRQNSGLLTVWVPANAKVYINGQQTSTKGSRRRYVSYGLQPGLTYKYVIRAEVPRNGMLAEEEKTVYLTAGAAEGVAFGFNRQPSNQVAAQP